MKQGSRLNWIHENYTNRDGVMTADPEIVPGALVIPVMTHEEARELMHGVIDRNGVIHGDAVELAARYGITLVVRNTHNPAAPGTYIVSSRESEGQPPIIGISGKSNITAIDVYDMGMAEPSNYLAPILTRIGEDAGLSISRIPMSEDGLKLIFNGDVPEQRLEDIVSFIKKRAISGSAAKVIPIRNEGEVYMVGQELKRPTVYTETLGEVATSLLADNLGFSEVISLQNSPSMAITVDDGNDVPATIRTLHEQFVEEA
jgi:aspartokinase